MPNFTLDFWQLTSEFFSHAIALARGATGNRILVIVLASIRYSIFPIAHVKHTLDTSVVEATQRLSLVCFYSRIARLVV
jgi:hypothetical protein